MVLNEDDIAESYDTNLKMNPPLRTKEDNEVLIAAVADGTIDCVVTDHAPHAAHEKEREFELCSFWYGRVLNFTRCDSYLSCSSRLYFV